MCARATRGTGIKPLTTCIEATQTHSIMEGNLTLRTESTR